MNQATRIGLIRGVIFYDLTLQDAEEDPVIGQMIRLRFFVGVIGNAYAVMTDRIVDVLNVHRAALPKEFLAILYRMRGRLKSGLATRKDRSIIQ
jgi:hypothetical protein